MNDIIVERNWYDDETNVTYVIRFVKVNDIWYAVLKDVCDAVGLKSWHVAQRIKPKYLLKRSVPCAFPKDNLVSNDVMSKPYHDTHIMLLVSEQGIYEVFDGGRKLKPRKFREWWTEIVMKLRQSIGLEAFQCFDMLDERVQQHITTQLERFLPEFDPYEDNIFYDEEKGMLMKSITLPGGDVDVVPYDGEEYKLVED